MMLIQDLSLDTSIEHYLLKFFGYFLILMFLYYRLICLLIFPNIYSPKFIKKYLKKRSFEVE